MHRGWLHLYLFSTMNFGEILKPIRTPNASYINGFSHFILGTFVLRIR